jgi:hypothetical protein
MDVTRRRLLALIGAGLGAHACGPIATPASPEPDLARLSPGERLEAIAKKIVSGGPGPDGIPPIEPPQYMPRVVGDRMWKDDAVVDAFVGPDGVERALPRFITVWHEIVNDEIAGEPLTFTYCPLTGSAVMFSGRLPDGRATSFGTSGSLYNSNLVMYDREDASLWPQLLGIAVDGARKGQRLREVPLVVTTSYGRWKERHADTLVLSTNTGRARAYGTWPYGDYDQNGAIMFPIDARDGRYHPKKIVVGVREGDAALAIAKDEFLTRRVANLELAGAPLVAMADPALATIRVFRRGTKTGILRFVARGDEVRDEETDSRWDVDGSAVGGALAGTKLERVCAFDVQWFAGVAFYKKTEVLA